MARGDDRDADGRRKPTHDTKSSSGGSGGARGGGGGRGGRGRRPMSREEQVSKAMSKLLRHQAVQEGLEVRDGGWVGVGEFLNNRFIKGLKVTFAELLELVESSDKQRFAIKPISSLEQPESTTSAAATPTSTTSSDIPPAKAPSTQNASTPATSADAVDPPPALADDQAAPSIPSASAGQSSKPARISPTANPSHFLIRATQGHTITFSADDLLTPLTLSIPANELPKLVVHGTTQSAWRLIFSSGGLKPMGRNHVHFATRLPLGWTEVLDTDISASDSTNAATATSTSTPAATPIAVAEDDASISALDAQAETDAPATSKSSSSKGNGKAKKDAEAVSGMRTSSKILIYLDLEKALREGLEFGTSSNGVVLTSGNEDGLVPLSLFRKVEDRSHGSGNSKGGSAVGRVILRDGVLC